MHLVVLDILILAVREAATWAQGQAVHGDDEASLHGFARGAQCQALDMGKAGRHRIAQQIRQTGERRLKWRGWRV